MTINLTKGGTVSLRKDAPLRARITWPPKTDYDVGAEVLYADGTTESVATFGASGLAASSATTRFPGAVRHLGDVVRSSAASAEEIIEITLNEHILAVVPWVYSAQSNGTGSFRRYAVAMEVTDGAETVRVEASEASDNDYVYTCVPGMITNLPGDGPHVHHLERYSLPHSENRPRVRLGGLLGGDKIRVDPDGGPHNDRK